MGAYNPLSSISAGIMFASTVMRFAKATLDMAIKTGPANYLGATNQVLVVGITSAKGTYEGTYDESNLGVTVGSQVSITHTFTSDVTLVVPMVVETLSWSADIDSPNQTVKVGTNSNGTFTAELI
jgi:hypothetical protein